VNQMDVKSIKNLFLRFWRSDNGKISLLRDILVALIAVLIILTALWAYTGQWFGAPMVAIESGSMMHDDEPYGRLGTIDAGDMVLLVKVNNRDDVVTYCEAIGQGNKGIHTYGLYGDVIVYRRLGDTDDDQIIHRSMCWVDVEINESGNLYTIEEYNITRQRSLYIPELGIKSPSGSATTPNWSHSGFITKGDNPHSNQVCDQVSDICPQPIKLEWISGKARSELPWIGTINLFFNDLTNGRFGEGSAKPPTVNNVPEDCLVCLFILIAILISIPIGLDFYDYYREKNRD